ncbi:MAG: outer membrane beta-barrel protein [Bacteroidota bacterium]
MTKHVLLAFGLLISICATAQDKKWSVEANYPISVGDELGNDNPAIIDLGIKYRFTKLGIIDIGAGLNAGVFRDEIQVALLEESFDFNETNWLIQPKVFAEIQIPALSKLRPFVSVGYTVITSKFDGDFPGLNAGVSDSSTDGGFNFGVGVSFDVTKNFFILVQYDYVRNSIGIDGLPDIKQDLGYFKIGVGYRF